MSHKLVEQAGENYAYLRTIVKNRIELYKIQFIEESSAVLSYGILVLCLVLIGFAFYVCMMLLLALWLQSKLGSTTEAILVVSGLILLKAALIILFRYTLIIKPLTKFIYTKVNFAQ